MLPSERRRLNDIAAREAAGESLWTDEFDFRVRVRLAEVWTLFAEESEQPYGPRLREQVATMLRAWAGRSLRFFDADVIRNTQVSSEVLLDGFAATAIAIEQMSPDTKLRADYESIMNDVLREHRIAHKFVDGELIPFESDELLQEVVEPALRLMAGSQFKAAHDAYMDALKEISNGDAGDAITDAGTALQQALVAVGAEGNALGPLMKDAKRRGILGSHDQPLIDGIGKFIDWVSSDRSTLGDAHDQSSAVIADAWLTVHVVGALIVRLADPALRGELTA